MTRQEQIGNFIEALERRGVSLANDTAYWDACRTYGEWSAEVRDHLRACVRYQRRVSAALAEAR